MGTERWRDGVYFLIPVVEYAAVHVDQRIITTPFVAEEALTADLVPLDIDAVLFWMVWNPKDACVEVEDYSSAIWWAAQTALRDAVGRINLAEVATRREQIDEEVKDILDSKTRAWGITVVSVGFATSPFPTTKTPFERSPGERGA
ncbi:MAG: SPFH domain-containing protein [Eggerthellaceae bacterium]